MRLCTIFPAWHANRYCGELINEGAVRFHSNASPLARRISAYQKGMRPKTVRESIGNPTTPVTDTLSRWIEKALDSAVQVSRYGVHYREVGELYRALYETYQDRTEKMMRRFSGIAVRDYNLEEFRRFYSAVLSIGGAHDHLNYRWSTGGFFPVETAIVVKHRCEWVSLIRELSGLATDISFIQWFGILPSAGCGQTTSISCRLLL